MSIHFEVAGAFVILGLYTFALFRWWFGHLAGLAARYDIAERRRRAGRRYVIVLLSVALPMLATVVGSFIIAPESGLVVVGAFACSIAPAVIWWFRRMPSLYALGYGRQSGH
jgi:hypothetical protein